MNQCDRIRMLTMDELSIKTGLQYDSYTASVIGNVNLPGHAPTPATKSLLFMLSEIRQRWKQKVAYYYTGETLILSMKCDNNLLATLSICLTKLPASL